MSVVIKVPMSVYKAQIRDDGNGDDENDHRICAFSDWPCDSCRAAALNYILNQLQSDDPDPNNQYLIQHADWNPMVDNKIDDVFVVDKIDNLDDYSTRWHAFTGTCDYDDRGYTISDLDVKFTDGDDDIIVSSYGYEYDDLKYPYDFSNLPYEGKQYKFKGDVNTN